MITAHSSKSGEYFKACIVVHDGEYSQSYKSVDMFLDRKTALKHAQAWRNESVAVGYVTLA